MKLNLPSLVVLFTTGLAITACKKTIDFEPISQNRIIEYKVVNLPDTLIYGAIDHIDKTITVYVPYYYSLNVIDPEISLSEGAKITEDIEPVSLTDTTTTYSVKSISGEVAIYKLKIKSQNPPTLDVSWNVAAVYNPYTVLSIQGNFMSSNAALAKVYLISLKDNKEIALNTANSVLVRSGDVTKMYVYSLLGLSVPVNIDTGYYKGRISFLDHTRELPAIHVTFKQPNINTNGEKIVARGGEFTYPAFPETVILNPKAVWATLAGVEYQLPIKAYTRENITLTMPANVPVGEYLYSPIRFELDGWATLNRTASITVTN